MNELKFGMLVNLFVNIIMGIALGLTGQILNQNYSIIGFLQNYIMSMGIGFLVGTWLPAMDIGKRVAHALGCREGLAEYLVSTFILAFLMILVMSVIIVFVQAGNMFLPVWSGLIGPFLIVGIIVIESTLWLIVRFAQKLL